MSDATKPVPTGVEEPPAKVVTNDRTALRRVTLESHWFSNFPIIAAFLLADYVHHTAKKVL